MDFLVHCGFVSHQEGVAGISSSGMVLVKQNCSSNAVLLRAVLNLLWEWDLGVCQLEGTVEYFTFF